MNNCRPHTNAAAASKLLEAIVQLYLDYHATNEERYLRFYAVQRSLPDAITKAAMAELPSGKRFSHQRRIPGTVLTQAKDALLKLDYSNVNSFSKLYEMVARTLLPIHGIGILTIYDTAHRLGAFLKLSPEVVYLHAGTRAGARALNLGYWKTALQMSAFPLAFQKLRPEQVEDCLCIYKRQLKAWSQIHLRKSV